MATNPYRLAEAVYMTAKVKKYLLKHSESLQTALKRFRVGDFGNAYEKPLDGQIRAFGSYDLPFGTLWIVSYDVFGGGEFISLLLPEEWSKIAKPSWLLQRS